MADFTFGNATVVIGDLNLTSGGRLDAFCCAKEVSVEFACDSEKIICDMMKGPIDRIDFNPTATVTLQEINFNPIVLSRALRLTMSYNTAGYRVCGNSSTDPGVLPTALNQVDGPFAPAYGGSSDAIVALNNGFILVPTGSFGTNLYAWSYDSATGVFSPVVITMDPSNCDPAIGVIGFIDIAETPVLYFTYKYDPMTPMSMELKNPWTLGGANDVFMRIYHEHGNGEDLAIFDFWRCRPTPAATLTLQTLTGDRTIPIDLKFDVFSDTRNHPDSPLMAITWDVIGRTITPEYGCAGETWATPVA